MVISDTPTITIITPVYKTPESYLWRFAESVLGQTHTEIQLIMVDDASLDHCPHVLDSIAQADERVKVLHRTENGRAGMARNDALDLVEEGYVLFADADDILQPDMCETLLQLALAYGADIVACGWSILDAEGKLIGQGYVPERQYDLANSRHKARALRNFNYALWNKLFRYDLIAPVRFRQFEANIGEDTLFNVEAFFRCRRILTTSYCGYNYIVHSESATGRQSRGMPYLRTIVESNESIRSIIAREDGTPVGLSFADRLALRRYSTGLGWIAANPDESEQVRMLEYWRSYLENLLLPTLSGNAILGSILHWLSNLKSPGIAYNLSEKLLWLSNPLSGVDRLGGRVAVFVNRCKSYSA